MDDFEGVSDNSDSFHLFTCVSAVELHRSDESFNNRAKGLSEFLDLVSAGSVGDKDLRSRRFACDVIDEARVFDCDIIV